MSIQQIEAVHKFLSYLGAAGAGPIRLDMLAEDVRYDWLAAQDVPVKRSLVGRSEVEGYLAILPHTYRILECDERIIHSIGDKTVVLGGERARLVRTGQIVRADWNAVFDFSEDLITAITMSIYRWTILSQPQLRQLHC